jgi:hypothetical protein
LLWGGLDNKGDSLTSGELFDPASGEFTSVVSYPSTLFPQPTDAPVLEASLPVDHAESVPTDTIISLRLSKPLKVETVNSNSVSLSGPSGIEKVKVVPAENGSLVFVTPEAGLLPGGTYTVTVNGAMDRDGLLLPVSGISFSTAAVAGGGASTAPLGQSGSSGSLSTSGTTITTSTTAQSPTDDDFVWHGELKDGKPHSPWQDLPPLQAPPGVTALSGQVLNLGGLPLANVALELEDAAQQKKSKKVETDETGRFLLTELEPGWQELVINGVKARVNRGQDSLANSPVENHGVFEYGLDIKAGQTTALPFTIWLPKIDSANAVTIPSPTTSEVVVTSPRIPGLELRLPPQTVIRDHEGSVVTAVSLTQIPIDRLPFRCRSMSIRRSTLPPNPAAPISKGTALGLSIPTRLKSFRAPGQTSGVTPPVPTAGTFTV